MQVGQGAGNTMGAVEGAINEPTASSHHILAATVPQSSVSQPQTTGNVSQAISNEPGLSANAAIENGMLEPSLGASGSEAIAGSGTEIAPNDDDDVENNVADAVQLEWSNPDAPLQQPGDDASGGVQVMIAMIMIILIIGRFG